MKRVSWIEVAFWSILLCVIFLTLRYSVFPMAKHPEMIQGNDVDFAKQDMSAYIVDTVASGSFEERFVEHSQRVIVADGWTPIYWKGYPLIGGGTWALGSQPEYKPATIGVDPYRVFDGEQAQCWFWFYNIGDAAIWKKVSVPGGMIQASVMAQAWVSDKDDNPHTSPGEMYVSIGIDPDGRDPGYSWPWETSVIWSPYMLIKENYRKVLSRPVYVSGEGNVTVYFRAMKKWSQKHGDVYLDDWSVYTLDTGGSVQPTYTPYPTYTPRPTATPYPTYTPAPTPACASTPAPEELACVNLLDKSFNTNIRRCVIGADTLYQDRDTREWICAK